MLLLLAQRFLAEESAPGQSARVHPPIAQQLNLGVNAESGKQADVAGGSSWRSRTGIGGKGRSSSTSSSAAAAALPPSEEYFEVEDIKVRVTFEHRS